MIVHFSKYKPYLLVEPIFKVALGEVALLNVAFEEPVGCDKIVHKPVCPAGTGLGVISLAAFKLMTVPSQNSLFNPAFGVLPGAETFTVTLSAVGAGQLVAFRFFIIV